MKRLIQLIVAVITAIVYCVHPVSVETTDTYAVTRSDSSFDGSGWGTIVTQ